MDIKKKLKPYEQNLLNDGVFLVKSLADENSVVSKPLDPTKAKNVPSDVSDDINDLLRNSRQHHEVFGSLAMESRTFYGRPPSDIDVAVEFPDQAAQSFGQALANKGHRVRIRNIPEHQAVRIEVEKNGGNWVEALDLHSNYNHLQGRDTKPVFIEPIPPDTVEGINIQTANEQLIRKGNSAMRYNEQTGEFGARKHRRCKDVTDFITTARLLIDSKQLRAEAVLKRVEKRKKEGDPIFSTGIPTNMREQRAYDDLAEVKKERMALASWKHYAKSQKCNVKNIDRDPIPENLEQMFIQQAVNKSGLEVNKIRFKSKKGFRELAFDDPNNLYPSLNDVFKMGVVDDVTPETKETGFIVNYFPGLGIKPNRKSLKNKSRKPINKQNKKPKKSKSKY